jgi:type II secretory pathway pseudopilin PulG
MKIKIKNTSESGFSYIEVMIAIVILMVGILALLAAITASVVRSRGQEEQLRAKQVATSTLESIMSVKETADKDRLGWIAVGNVGSNPDDDDIPRGVFVVGETEVLSNPGPDEVMGTADDTGASVGPMTREIVITDVCDPDRPSPNCPTPGTNPVRMRAVQVTVTYFIGTTEFTERINTVLTDYQIEDEDEEE